MNREDTMTVRFGFPTVHLVPAEGAGPRIFTSRRPICGSAVTGDPVIAATFPGSGMCRRCAARVHRR